MTDTLLQAQEDGDHVKDKEQCFSDDSEEVASGIRHGKQSSNYGLWFAGPVEFSVATIPIHLHQCVTIVLPNGIEILFPDL